MFYTQCNIRILKCNHIIISFVYILLEVFEWQTGNISIFEYWHFGFVVSWTILRLTYQRWSPPIVFRISEKKCKTLFNWTVRNYMLHPWLLYLSAHLKPILSSEVSIMSNECTWRRISHHMCIFTCKIARISANVFIYTDNILTKLYYPYYHHCIYCTIFNSCFLVYSNFENFNFCFCSLFSFIIIIFFITKNLLCYVCHFFIVTRHWLIVK